MWAAQTCFLAYHRDVDGPSLQERFAPDGRCFGCGPNNEHGLRIRSFEADDGTVVAEWQPGVEHEAFDGFVNGGILGTLIDCHSNWTAIAALLERSGASEAPSTVTAEYAVRFRRPTPSDRPLRLVGRAVEIADDRVPATRRLAAGSRPQSVAGARSGRRRDRELHERIAQAAPDLREQVGVVGDPPRERHRLGPAARGGSSPR